MHPTTRPVLVLIAGLLPSCGGGYAPAGPSAPGATEITTFMGTTRATGPMSCSGDSHDIQAQAGAIAVTLVQTTGNTALVVQVCAGGIDNNDCSLNQTRIAVGQTLNATRKGGTSQNVKLLPLNCSPQPEPPPPGPVDYTVTVSYQR